MTSDSKRTMARTSTGPAWRGVGSLPSTSPGALPQLGLQRCSRFLSPCHGSNLISAFGETFSSLTFLSLDGLYSTFFISYGFNADL